MSMSVFQAEIEFRVISPESSSKCPKMLLQKVVLQWILQVYGFPSVLKSSSDYSQIFPGYHYGQ